MTKHRAVVTGYDPTYENPDGSTGRPKGVQTAADMRVATSYDVLEEGIFALHGTPAVVTSPVNTIQITPFMAAIESPNGGYYVIKITENETVELNLTNTGNVKVYVQQQDWELENDVAAADSAVVFGVAYGATAIPEGALLLFTSTLSGQTSTSGMTFTPAFKWTGAASGVIRVPTQAALPNVAVLQTGIRALALDESGEFYYGADDVWHSTQTANPSLDTGWVSVPDTWSYSSWSSSTRTGVITVPSDATLKYTAGMRVRIEQATGGVKYGIITRVTSTSLSVFFPLGTTFTNQTISSPHFSMWKVPFGFNADPTLWELEIVDTNVLSKTSPAAGVWYYSGLSITLPVGAWRVGFSLSYAGLASSASAVRAKVTLATASATETDSRFTTYLGATAVTVAISDVSRLIARNHTAQTTYYLNMQSTNSAANDVQILGSANATRIFAQCAHL